MGEYRRRRRRPHLSRIDRSGGTVHGEMIFEHTGAQMRPGSKKGARSRGGSSGSYHISTANQQVTVLLIILYEWTPQHITHHQSVSQLRTNVVGASSSQRTLLMRTRSVNRCKLFGIVRGRSEEVVRYRTSGVRSGIIRSRAL